MTSLPNSLATCALLVFAACAAEFGDLPEDPIEDESADQGVPDDQGGEDVGDEDPGDDDPVDPEDVESSLQALGLERVDGLRRFDLANISCPASLLESAAGCPADDEKCLCRPEFNALNGQVGSPGNPEGRVILMSQPQWGKRSDGSYVFDAYTAVNDAGNVVGHYVNALNPSLSCTASESWTGEACDGGGGCGWRCVTGQTRANQIVNEVNAKYVGYPVPQAIALNEAWSVVYQESQTGKDYRTWLRNLTRRMKERNRLPLLFIQERHEAAGPYPLLREISSYALIMVEAYVSGVEAVKVGDDCAPPYDSTNFCYRYYDEVRNAVRNSASPAIPYNRLVMVEHFGTNTRRFVDGKGNPRIAGWGRAYDDDPNSATFGAPTISKWATIVERRARAVKALPNLGGVGSYAWGGNSSGTGSTYRVNFAKKYSSVSLP